MTATQTTNKRRPGDRIRHQQAHGKKPPMTALIAAVIGLGGGLALAVYSANKVIAYAVVIGIAIYVVAYFVDTKKRRSAK
jgi:heme O synthase-like polyprenyltransferase